jgi:hypothetical protein
VRERSPAAHLATVRHHHKLLVRGIMAREFEYNILRKITNRVIVSLLKIGGAPDYYRLLTVKGRNTGIPHSVPVVLINYRNKKYLIAPYGEVDWVKNARVAGFVNIMHKRRGEEFLIRELEPNEAAPLLKIYFEEYPITKSYFDVGDDPSVDEFLSEAISKPVFELSKGSISTSDSLPLDDA